MYRTYFITYAVFPSPHPSPSLPFPPLLLQTKLARKDQDILIELLATLIEHSTTISSVKVSKNYTRSF